MSLLLLPFRKRNAFSVKALITSHAVVLLGMLSVMNAEKLDFSLKFVSRKIPNIWAALLPEHYIASVVGAPACLQSAVVDIKIQGLPDCALLDTGASDSYVDSDVASKKLVLEYKGQSSCIALASTTSSAKVRGIVTVIFLPLKDRTALN